MFNLEKDDAPRYTLLPKFKLMPHTDPAKIIRTKVESSNIASIGYDQASRTLVVEFMSGQIYSYHPVTPAGYESLRAADSVGAHFAKHFKNNEKLSYVKLP